MLKQKVNSKAYRRPHYERAGALTLAVMTMLGAATIDKPTRNFYRELIVNPSFAFRQITERENETGRTPVQFDTVLHRPTVGSA